MPHVVAAPDKFRGTATARQVANAVVVTSSSSRYVARNFWVDPKNGTSYQVQVEVPTPRMNSTAQLETVSLAEVNPELNLFIRDVARVGQGTHCAVAGFGQEFPECLPRLRPHAHHHGIAVVPDRVLGSAAAIQHRGRDQEIG